MVWSRRRLTKRAIERAVAALSKRPVSKLSANQRAILVQLVADDWRCAEALPDTLADSTTRVAFADLLRRYWVEEPLYHVADLRDRFLGAAEALRHDSRPAASILLYTAWIESTLTLILVRALQRSGAAGTSLDQYAEQVAAKSAGENAAAVARTPLAQPVPSDLAKEIGKLFTIRKFAIHFRWVGTDERVLNARLARLSKGAVLARNLVHDLRKIETRVTTLHRLPDALSVFGLE